MADETHKIAVDPEHDVPTSNSNGEKLINEKQTEIPVNPVSGMSPELKSKEEAQITRDSDLRLPNRRIWIVTTASLPWRTGTSVNPLARALYLARGRPKNHVTLVIPWLTEREDQSKVFGEDCIFNTMEEQEKWIRQYCKERVHCEKEMENLRIRFYPAFYHDVFGSIFATVDICALIPNQEADVAILEEPEHLTWFRVPPEIDENTEKSIREKAELGWAVKFNHVVGILHTNYPAYLDQYGMGTSFIAASALSALSSIVVRAYCHRLIRLSATLPELDKTKEITCNVHGVRSEFLDPPRSAQGIDDQIDPSPIYFIGKLIWAKGFDKLLEFEDLYRKETGNYFSIDVYGAGSNEEAIKRAFFGRKGITNVSIQQETEKSKGSVEIPKDQTAALIFGREGSLRSQLDVTGEGDLERDPEARLTGISSVNPREDQMDSFPNPLGILGDLSGRTMDTGVTAMIAGGKLSEKLVDLAFHATFSKANKEDVVYFDPPKSKFELRKHPIPARFLGVKDHAIIRDIPGHKIFLNLSETEVLCTTTAEALAMGKFVIIPMHPSNIFFQQFTNCLTYSSKEDCVKKIKWALQSVPEPLTPEQAFMLTWEGANERLFVSAALTKGEVESRKDTGRDKADRDLARLHIESGKKGQFVHNFLKNRQT